MRYSDQYFYHKLEIDEIINQLVNFTCLDVTKEYFRTFTPMIDEEEIKLALAKVKEALGITVRYERSPIYLTMDYQHLLDIASKGGILSGLELFETVRLFSTIRANKRLLELLIKEHFECKYFKEYVDDLYLDLTLEKMLRNAIDDTGYVLDSASPALQKIRNKLKGLDERIKSKVQEIISNKGSYLSDSIVVIRNDRYCVCVKAEYKNSFPGILHDVSSSNLTAYMEPLGVAELTNEKDRLRNEEKLELEKILRLLSNQVMLQAEVLQANYEIIIELDKIFAKALLGISYDGYAPKINTKGILKLKDARHPLLKVEKVIPNNIEFGENYLGIVITGPNTGGKTVLLKTVGLLSLMVKFGLLIPAAEDSDVMIYDHILCDIGDDQSIKENLSTFSSHMRKMIAIVNLVTPNSLALFDEIGSGTDPVEGSAIAIAVLKYFIKNKVSFITTTHYAELKTFAYTTDELVNASMAFNEDTMQPTYHLVIGKSGSSNAISIASNLGLKKNIINDARRNLSKHSNQTSDLIKKIELKNQQLEAYELELKNSLQETDNLKAEYNRLLNMIKQEKDKIIEKAKQEANEIINQATFDATTLLEEIKMLQNKNLKLHEIIDIKAQIDKVNRKKSVEESTKSNLTINDIKIGDRVYLKDYQQYGNITRIRKDKTIDVAIGNISVNVEINEMELSMIAEKPEVNNIVIERSETGSKRVGLSLDLRGVRVNDAKEMLEKYIDDLILSNIKSATIIHGFGTGAIRELVQDFCRKSKYIDIYRYGGAGEGGLGVTVITLK